MLHSRQPIPAQPTAPTCPFALADDPRRCGCGVSLDELVARMLLEQRRHRLGQQRLGGEVVEANLLAPRARLLAAVGGDGDDWHVHPHLLDGHRGAEAVHDVHAQVHQHERVQPGLGEHELLERLLAVLRVVARAAELLEHDAQDVGAHGGVLDHEHVRLVHGLEARPRHARGLDDLLPRCRLVEGARRQLEVLDARRQVLGGHRGRRPLDGGRVGRRLGRG
mmetsp:Transcript_63652/g.153720  ORF Transcript_63652/g.153720 Transcript_63652/m.153720 type:complete len:222 (+) Transcript_63652:133-798(+)